MRRDPNFFSLQKTMPEKTLKFYDLKKKKSFTTKKWKRVVKGGKTFAVTTAPSGVTSWRILGKS